MGDLMDFQNFEGQFRSELEAIDSEAIAPADQETIERWVRDAHSGLATSSITEYLRRVRLTAERLDTRLVDATKDDINAILFAYGHEDQYGRGGGGMSEHSLRNYRKALRVFFKWLNGEGSWADDLDVGAPPANRISPDEMLTQDDIAALVDAATKARDIAMIEFFADTGARTSMAGSLRVGDVDLDTERPHYEPNPEATGLKDAPQHNYPLIDAVAPLRAYLRYSHPQPDNGDVALFHTFVGADSDPADLPDNKTAMTSEHMRRRLRKIAATAGVEKPVNPHNFRHSAVSRMYREGFTKQQIQHRVGWTLDTSMWSRYVHLTSEELNDAIYQETGQAEPADEHTTERRNCGNCRETLAPHHEYCPRCGAPASEATRELKQEATSAIATGMVAAEDLSDREFRALVLRHLELDPSDLGGHESPPSPGSSD